MLPSDAAGREAVPDLVEGRRARIEGVGVERDQQRVEVRAKEPGVGAQLFVRVVPLRDDREDEGEVRERAGDLPNRRPGITLDCRDDGRVQSLRHIGKRRIAKLSRSRPFDARAFERQARFLNRGLPGDRRRTGRKVDGWRPRSHGLRRCRRHSLGPIRCR